MRYLQNLATFLLPATLPRGFSWRHPRQRAEDGGEMALMWEDYLQMRQALSRLMRASGARSWPRTSEVPMPMAAQAAQVRRAARKLWRNVRCRALSSPAASARRDSGFPREGSHSIGRPSWLASLLRAPLGYASEQFFKEIPLAGCDVDGDVCTPSQGGETLAHCARPASP
jgi:hypothetical protein